MHRRKRVGLLQVDWTKISIKTLPKNKIKRWSEQINHAKISARIYHADVKSNNNEEILGVERKVGHFN